MKDIDEISKLNRVQEVPESGIVSDLLWSDPDEKEGWGVSPRGAGSLFGPDVSKEFCYINKLNQIIRAHQLVMEGYAWSHDNVLCTLFSAPNYCNKCGNKGSIMEMDEFNNTLIQQFDSSIHDQSEYYVNKSIPDYFL